MEHAGGRFVVSDAQQSSRRLPSRNLPPALPTARPRASDLTGQQVDGKVRGGDPDMRRCPRKHDVDLRLHHRLPTMCLHTQWLRQDDPDAGCWRERKNGILLRDEPPAPPTGLWCRQGFTRSSTQPERRIPTACMTHLVRRPATMTASEICRVLRTPILGPPRGSSPERQKSQTAGAVWLLA